MNLGIVKNYPGAESLARGMANFYNETYESVTINEIRIFAQKNLTNVVESGIFLILQEKIKT